MESVATVPLLIIDDFGMRKLPHHRCRGSAGNHHAPLRTLQHASNFQPTRRRLGQLTRRCRGRQRHARSAAASWPRAKVRPPELANQGGSGNWPMTILNKFASCGSHVELDVMQSDCEGVIHLGSLRMGMWRSAARSQSTSAKIRGLQSPAKFKGTPAKPEFTAPTELPENHQSCRPRFAARLGREVSRIGDPRCAARSQLRWALHCCAMELWYGLQFKCCGGRRNGTTPQRYAIRNARYKRDPVYRLVVSHKQQLTHRGGLYRYGPTGTTRLRPKLYRWAPPDSCAPTQGAAACSAMAQTLIGQSERNHSGRRFCLTWGLCRVGDRRAARTHVSCLPSSNRTSAVSRSLVWFHHIRCGMWPSKLCGAQWATLLS